MVDLSNRKFVGRNGSGIRSAEGFRSHCFRKFPEPEAPGHSAGVPNDGGFYLAASATVKAHPELIRAALQAFKEAGAWATRHPYEASVLTASDVGLDVQTLERTYAQGNNTEFRPIVDTIVRQQQEQADLFERLGVLPRHIHVRDVILPPSKYAQLLGRPTVSPSRLPDRIAAAPTHKN